MLLWNPQRFRETGASLLSFSPVEPSVISPFERNPMLVVSKISVRCPFFTLHIPLVTSPLCGRVFASSNVISMPTPGFSKGSWFEASSNDAGP